MTKLHQDIGDTSCIRTSVTLGGLGRWPSVGGRWACRCRTYFVPGSGHAFSTSRVAVVVEDEEPVDLVDSLGGGPARCLSMRK